MESFPSKEEKESAKKNEPVEEKTKEKDLVVQKIFKNKAKYAIINVLSYILNNENNFSEKLKSEDFKLQINCDANAFIDNNFIYTIKLTNDSFNPERDNNKNLNYYKSIKPNYFLDDEYYGKSNILNEIEVDLMPRLVKNTIFSLDFFDFKIYNETTSKYETYKKPNEEEKKFQLILFLFNNSNIGMIMECVGEVESYEGIWDIFENLKIICSCPHESKFKEVYDAFQKKEFKDKSKIKLLFYLKNENNSKKETDTIDIFSNFKKKEDFFFILSPESKIIKFELIKSFIRATKSIVQNIQKDKNYFSKVQKTKDFKNKKGIQSLEKILNFIKGVNRLNYCFNFDFSFSFYAKPNEDLTDIIATKVSKISLKGEMRTKEIKEINKLISDIDEKKRSINLAELETIDVDIDFNEMKCTKCKEDIPENKELYYCYICKTKYCMKCVDAQLKKAGREQWIDPNHNLIFFKTRDKNLLINLDKHKLGNNRCTRDSEFSNRHSAMCNGCGGDFYKSARYICVSCRPGIHQSGGYVDFCGSCMDQLINNRNTRNIEDRTQQELHGNLNSFSRNHTYQNLHNHQTHVYLMLPLQAVNGGYQNY